MNMNKNEFYRIKIEDLGNDGQGIGHIDKMAVFVKDTLPGDEAWIKIIKLKKNYAFGKLTELITPSPWRVQPLCEKAASCGGCTLQHMSYEKQLEYKWNKVKECLERIGGVENAAALMEPVFGMDTPYNYRNKMQFPVSRNKNGELQIGFYAGHTHSIINLEECPTGHPVNTVIIQVMRDFINKFNISTYNEEKHTGLLRHIITRTGFETGELMVCLVINGNNIKYGDVLYEMLYERIEKWKTSDEGKKYENIKLTSLMININTQKTNKILGDVSKVVRGQGYITDYIGDIKFRISPQSFFQVNPAQTKVLYNKALEYAALTGNETVWDMYCGIGTISLFLAKSAGHVFGVEIVPQAVEDAKENAKINGISNVSFYAGKAEVVAPQLIKAYGDKARADVVVVDPPRKGCDSVLLDTIVEIAPKRLVYVSCDPATLARDIKYLSEFGYELRKVSVVDQFSHSVHVETVVLMSRVNAT